MVFIRNILTTFQINEIELNNSTTKTVTKILSQTLL